MPWVRLWYTITPMLHLPYPMPTRYVIDKERRLIISTGWDRISCADILAHRNQLKNDPDFDPSYNQLVDGRAVTGLNLSLDETKAIASGSPFSLASRRALVARDLAVLGIARLAEAYSGAGKGREEVRVFHDFSAALAWLGVKLEAEDI